MMQEYNFNTTKKPNYWLIGIAIVALLIGIMILSTNEKDDTPVEKTTKQTLAIPKAETNLSSDTEQTDQTQYDFAEQLPLYDQEDWRFEGDGSPLPDLEDSDAEYTRDLLAVSPQLQQALFTDEQIRKTIFSINDIAQGLRPPVKRLREISFSEPFSVTRKKGKMFISTQSYHRYDSLAQAINSINIERAVALYQKYLPLFQAVFAEFSYPENYQVLDSIQSATGKIIQAPVITGKIEVTHPSVRYKFADPTLEKLSALDKQMLRMGPDNTRSIQKKLRELIEALIAVK